MKHSGIGQNQSYAQIAFGETRRIDFNHPVYGHTISHGRREVDTGDANHVASAFYKRSFLVELEFTERRFVVAISDLEVEGEKTFAVTTPQKALTIARRRALRVFKDEPLGGIVSWRVLPDCAEAREELGVGGPITRTEYSDTWRNAA
jgi:hypothetical protein